MKKCICILSTLFLILVCSQLLLSQVPVIVPKQQTPNPTSATNYIKNNQDNPLILFHTATGGNTLNGISVINTENLSGISNPIIIATSLWGKSSKNYYNRPILLKRFNNGEWGIDVSNPTSPGNDYNNVDFNLLVSKPSENAFVHTAQNNNTSGLKTRLNHPLLNGKPEAKFLITQVQADGIKNLNPSGVLYENGYWHIVNLNKIPMPVGATYNVIVSNQINTVTAVNPMGNIYIIKDKRIQNNPNISVFTTTVINGNVFNPNEVGVFYAKTAAAVATTPSNNQGNWAIFNQNKSPIPPNTQFNVLVLEKGQITSGSDFRQGPPPLTGFVDMHTHLMSHLGFSGVALYGAPDIGSLMPTGSVLTSNDPIASNCNASPVRCNSVEMALGNCNASHGGYGIDNKCGDYLRMAIISKALDADFYANADLDHPHTGYPNFESWPHHSSILHQQMWWEWVKRAWQGGMRVMVVLAVNNELLGNAFNGANAYDDKSVADLQISETKKFVERHSDFIEIAYSPADLRRIVGSGKLAFILGIEVDNIGNFNKVNCNETMVRNEVRRLYDLGIRYAFPVHLTDNKFGGSAVFSWIFNMSNRYNTGSFYSVETSLDPNVKFNFNLTPVYFLENSTLASASILESVGYLPVPPGLCNGLTVNSCGSYQKIINNLLPSTQIEEYKKFTGGHINKYGLFPLGEVALNEMMKLGIMIDIDHMSEKAMSRSIDIANTIPGGYPLNMGHSEVRGPGGKERNAPASLITKISQLGGMFGIGTCHSNAYTFIRKYNIVAPYMGVSHIAIGTDANGFEPLPYWGTGKPNKTLISTSFYTSFFAQSGITTKSSLGNKVWDYFKDGGVSHYGMLPEFLHDVKTNPDIKNEFLYSGGLVYNNLKNSAEYFTQMWEKCERVKVNVP